MSKDKTTATPGDPLRDGPATFLLAHGWRPVGEPLPPEDCLWIDPDRPNSIEHPRGTYGREKVLAPDVSGDLRPVFVKGKDGRPEEVSQVHWTPPRDPLDMKSAVREQVTRELAAAAAALRKAA